MGQHGQGMVKRPDELRSSMTISGLNDEQNKQNVVIAYFAQRWCRHHASQITRHGVSTYL